MNRKYTPTVDRRRQLSPGFLEDALDEVSSYSYNEWEIDEKVKHLPFPPSSMEFYYLTGTFHLGDHKHCFRHWKAYSLHLPVVFWSIFLYMSVQA